MSVPAILYRGDKCGLTSVGFESFEAKSRGKTAALKDLLAVDTDELDRRMQNHASSKFLSCFVSTTNDIRVACYFATTGCTNNGCIYVLQNSALARSNPFNAGDLILCDGKTLAKEQEWVWFSYIDPKFILDEIMVSPADCRCLPNP